MKMEKRRITLLILVMLCIFASSCSEEVTFSKPSSFDNKVKNIIFCIGDGMGLGQVFFTRIHDVGVDGKLNMEQMPVTGIIRTHSANALVTDSAAAATAMSSGIKTNNGMLGMNAEKNEYQTILQAAKEQGLMTGLVATSAITHATPAAFASHVESRGMQNQIAEQLLANKVNVLLGGGRAFFLPKTNPNSKRTDEKDLLLEAEKSGYTYIETAEELALAKGEYLLGLFQVDALTTKSPEPTLAELTDKAIEILSVDKQGFFLMVEGSQIDWACHANDIEKNIRQTRLFDEAVKQAIDFAIEDKHTLVLVTADHETGGLTVNGGNLNGQDLDVHWSTGGHTGLPVVVYAFGPGAEQFTGVYDNTDIPKKFAELLGIESFPVAIEKAALNF